jgi:hypothetical protein
MGQALQVFCGQVFVPLIAELVEIFPFYIHRPHYALVPLRVNKTYWPACQDLTRNI